MTANRRGKPLKAWTEKEIRILSDLWPDRKALVKKLKGRSFDAIQWRASHTGLTTKLHVWTVPEVRRLQSMWAGSSHAELLEAFPWATWTVLTNQAQFQKLHRSPKKYQNRFPELNQISERAKALGITRPQLDKLAKTKRYFRRANRLSWPHVASAVEVLGGRIEIQWEDF